MTEQKPAPSSRLLNLLREYPTQFWVLVSASFIDRLGGAMLFPFFTLYMTRKFDIGMTQVGVLFFLFAVTSMIGNLIGGALTDRLGRKGMIVFGLVMSAMSALLMGFINDLALFFIVIPLVGILSDAAGPAHQALVADLLPEHKRAQGYGILRVVFNLAVVIGPLIGGLLASRNYLYLFITDAVTSTLTALIVLLVIKETRKATAKDGEKPESMLQTFRGYGKALSDSAFMWFMVASSLMVFVYIQMNTTLAVYLNTQHGIDETYFSYILALNAAMVVLMQFPITRVITRYRPLMVMAVGTLLYAIGFGMYGFVGTFFLFMVAMVIITMGEMFVSPVGQAIVAQLAPEDMRGRYMATYGFSWMIPFMFGPILAGLILDNLNPNVLWYSAGILGLVAAAVFYFMERLVGRARWAAIDRRLEIMQQLEDGEITAESAALALSKVAESALERLAPKPAVERRHVRFRISNLASGELTADMRLPVGLVNTVLYTGGQFSPSLALWPHDRLREAIEASTAEETTRQIETDEERVEISIE